MTGIDSILVYKDKLLQSLSGSVRNQVYPLTFHAVYKVRSTFPMVAIIGAALVQSLHIPLQLHCKASQPFNIYVCWLEQPITHICIFISYFTTVL